MSSMDIITSSWIHPEPRCVFDTLRFDSCVSVDLSAFVVKFEMAILSAKQSPAQFKYCLKDEAVHETLPAKSWPGRQN